MGEGDPLAGPLQLGCRVRRHDRRLHRVTGEALVSPQIGARLRRVRLDAGEARLAAAFVAGRMADGLRLIEVCDDAHELTLHGFNNIATNTYRIQYLYNSCQVIK